VRGLSTSGETGVGRSIERRLYEEGRVTREGEVRMELD
jgi:hypothetical protein